MSDEAVEGEKKIESTPKAKSSQSKESIHDILHDMAKSRTRKIITSNVKSGRRADVITAGRRGRYVRARKPHDEAKDIALGPTIRAAIMRTGVERGGNFARRKPGERLIEIKKSDLREKVRRIKMSTLICLIFDASSSMVREEKLRSANAVIDDLLLDAYQKRDRISLITYSGNTAEVVLPFTSSIELAKPYLSKIQFGGTTPFAAGLLTGLQNVETKMRVEPDAIPIMIVITDGTANTTINPGEDLNRELMEISSLIRESNINVLIIDVSKEGSELAKEVANLCGGRYYYSGRLGKTSEFTDLVDQEMIIDIFKLAIINTDIGGLAIKGATSETIESTLAAIKEVVPDVETLLGCKFGCSPDEPDNFCWDCKTRREKGQTFKDIHPPHVIRMPSNASAEDLVGTFDSSSLWDLKDFFASGESPSKHFKPGLLAKANRGVLFIEGIDKLSDDVLETLSYVLITGMNAVKVGPYTLTHPINLTLVGTVEDQSKIHPLLLDRFGLMIDMMNIDAVEKRILFLKQRKEFDTDSKKFQENLKNKRKMLRTEIIKAQALLPEVHTSDDHLDLIARISIDSTLVGHTSDILIEKVARSIAAGENRTRATEDDIVKASAMVVPLRVSEEKFHETNFTKQLTTMVREYE